MNLIKKFLIKIGLIKPKLEISYIGNNKKANIPKYHSYYETKPKWNEWSDDVYKRRWRS